MFRPEHLTFFIEQGSAWVADNHARYYLEGQPLSQPILQRLSPFFGTETSRRIRIVVHPLIPNPPFYSILAAQGVPAPIDFTQMAGITFVDTVLISQTRADFSDSALTSLLFHEAVHVVQYEDLGIDAFIRDYVMGWAENGFEYLNIPLEREAYALQNRFENDPLRAFSVHEELEQ